MQPGDWVRVTKPLYAQRADVMPSDRLIYLGTKPHEWRQRWVLEEGHWDVDNYPLTWVPTQRVVTGHFIYRTGYHLAMRPGRTRYGRGTVLNPVFKIPLGLLRSVEKTGSIGSTSTTQRQNESRNQK